MHRKAILLLLLFFCLNSCGITQKMWNPHYTETLSGFLFSQDGRFVVFLGREFHYILNDDSGIIKRMLFSPCRALMYLSVNSTYINLSQSNDLDAYVTIKIVKEDIGSFAENELTSIGFIKGADGVLTLHIKLTGKRYLANRNLSAAFTLNNRYSIKVYEEISSTGKIEKAMLTPITLTLDTVLSIGKVLLVPFAGN
jgi:hypothetical protein